MKTVKVMFDCKVCGAKGAIVLAEAREFEQDLKWWVQEVVCRAISARHHHFCENRVVDLLLPCPKNPDGWIGQAVEDGAVYE